MKRNKYRKLCCGLLAGMLLFGSISPMAAFAEEEKRITHGTATEWITEDMVNNTPPADYKVNEDIRGKAENGKYSEYFLKEELQEVHIEVDENNLNYIKRYSSYNQYKEKQINNDL